MMGEHTKNSLTWYPYDVASHMASTMQLSLAARGLDQILTDHAWSNVDGSCSVTVATLMGLCEREKLDAKALYAELIASQRWARQDKATMVSTWLPRIRNRADEVVEKRRKAGLLSAEKRKEKAAAKQAARAKAKAKKAPATAAPLPEAVSHELPDNPREHVLNARSHDLPESPDVSMDEAEMEAGNPLPANDMNMCSTPAQQRTASSPSSLPTVEKEGEEEAGVSMPAPAAAARHAEGAASSADASVGAAAKQPPFIPALIVEQQLRDLSLPGDWMDAETATLVATLTPAASVLEVALEAALWSLYAPHCGPNKADGHVALRDELIALLHGTEGRAGWLPVDDAPVAIVAACFGALAHKTPIIGPILFRAIASATAKALRDGVQDEPRVIAARLALEFSGGKRKASAYELPCDPLRPTSRLFGHPTKAEPAA